jgi:glycerol-3-phosphate dehydrogenase
MGMLPSRQATLAALAAPARFDLAIVGGGATGCGLALDAAARGFTVALFEAEDFAKGTSSRATKLVHGGVRYLAQGNVSLVREALQERTRLLANAPHLAQPLPFVMPAYRFWEQPFYGVGLKMYDALAGALGLGETEFLSAGRTQQLVPNVQRQGPGGALKGGVKYWDGQFDDARLALALARTAQRKGALVLNHCAVTSLVREGGKTVGVVVRDAVGGSELRVAAQCVVNATGVWVDDVRAMDHGPNEAAKRGIVAPSQGVHLVVDRRFWPSDHALLVPKTEDGRVLFAVPWLGKTILGTTDTPRKDVVREPVPFAAEVEFILREAGRYLATAPTRADVRSVWVGLRPLVKPDDEDSGNTKALSREHTVIVGRSGLVTVTGGKWTTYRAMAEDVLDRIFDRQLLPRRAGGVTTQLPLIGAPAKSAVSISAAPGEHLYGTEVEALHALPGADRWLWRDPESKQSGLSEAMVRFAARFEMAMSVEDVLARRCRLLFLDAAEAARQADAVAQLLSEELGADFDQAASSAAFKQLAAQYLRLP